MAHFPKVSTLYASAVRVTAVSNSGGTAVTNLANMSRAVILLDVTAMGGAAGDLLHVYVDVLAPDGVTWLNAVRFPHVDGNSAAVQYWACLDATAVAATTFDVTADCAEGVTKPYLWGSAIRGRYTLVNAGGGGQSATFSLTALLQ